MHIFHSSEMTFNAHLPLYMQGHAVSIRVVGAGEGKGDIPWSHRGAPLAEELGWWLVATSGRSISAVIFHRLALGGTRPLITTLHPFTGHFTAWLLCLSLND